MYFPGKCCLWKIWTKKQNTGVNKRSRRLSSRHAYWPWFARNTSQTICNSGRKSRIHEQTVVCVAQKYVWKNILGVARVVSATVDTSEPICIDHSLWETSKTFHNTLKIRSILEYFSIYDNYAGREGRGTLFGIRRAEKFMRQVTHNYQKPAFILKLDIASYFRSIPKERLVSVILGQVNPFAEQGMNVTRVSSRNTLRKANRIIFVLLTAKVRKTAESK